MAIETLGDILEELADKLGVNGAEERNAWVINMGGRIIATIETMRAVQRNYGESIDKMREGRLERVDLETRRLNPSDKTPIPFVEG